MPKIIKVFPGEPLYRERVRLEDRDYVFRFDWSNREQRFYMSIKDQDDVLLLLGIKIIANSPLIGRHHFNLSLPPGEFLAMDLEQGGEPPTFNDFGTRVRLFYFESTEDLTEFDTAPA